MGKARTKKIADLVRRIYKQKDWIARCRDSTGGAVRKMSVDRLQSLFEELVEARRNDR